MTPPGPRDLDARDLRARNLYARMAAGFDHARPSAELPDGRRLTYADVEALSARFAGALVARGVRPGDRVAAQVGKGAAALMLYLGAVRAGAVFLPLNTAYTPAEVDYFLRDAEPALFVCDPARAGALAATAAAAGAPLATLGADGGGALADEATARPAGFETVARGDDDLAAILYTSGTTGRSKGAELTHDNLASNALALVDLWRFTPDDVLLHALPIFHTHGLFVATNVALFSGCSLLLRPKFDAREALGLLTRSTAMMGVPTFYARLLAEPGLTREAVAGVRLFVSGSAPLPAGTHRAFEARTGHAVLERYGMTETNMIASNPYDGERVAGTVGFALPGVSLRVAAPDTGEVLAPGAVGVIEVKGPNVFKGYWRNPAKTAEEFRADGYFITGDLGALDGEGRLSIVGRAKDLVITGGYNVYPKEVEDALDALPGVAESAVVGLPHPDLGEGVTAMVVPEPGAALDEAALLAALEERLAAYKRPKRVLVVAELPRNAMGKVQKALLREANAGLYGG